MAQSIEHIQNFITNPQLRIDALTKCDFDNIQHLDIESDNRSDQKNSEWIRKRLLDL